MEAPTPELLERLRQLCGRLPAKYRRVTGGYTPAQRWIVELDDDVSYFVKTGTERWAERLRIEHLVYSSIRAPFMPRMIAWEDDGVAPILVLEDLSAGVWPPPWTPERIQGVLTAMADVRACTLPGLRTLEEFAGQMRDEWGTVERDPGPFLSLGMCSAAWLSRNLRVLDVAARSVDLTGRDFLHLDLRSDNLCFAGDRVLLVDWDGACVGNGVLDVAGWLPSLHSEGGPLPESILPAEPEMASMMAGYFASHAGLAMIPSAPRVRNIQLEQLRSALPWAVRALSLPLLDGAAQSL